MHLILAGNEDIIPVTVCVEVLFLSLLLPARHGQLKCVRLLLERGARVVPDNEGVSPLELCAQVAATVASSTRMVLMCSPSPVVLPLLPSHPSRVATMSVWRPC